MEHISELKWALSFGGHYVQFSNFCGGKNLLGGKKSPVTYIALPTILAGWRIGVRLNLISFTTAVGETDVYFYENVSMVY